MSAQSDVGWDRALAASASALGALLLVLLLAGGALAEGEPLEESAASAVGYAGTAGGALGATALELESAFHAEHQEVVVWSRGVELRVESATILYFTEATNAAHAQDRHRAEVATKAYVDALLSEAGEATADVANRGIVVSNERYAASQTALVAQRDLGVGFSSDRLAAGSAFGTSGRNSAASFLHVTSTLAFASGTGGSDLLLDTAAFGLMTGSRIATGNAASVLDTLADEIERLLREAGEFRDRRLADAAALSDATQQLAASTQAEAMVAATSGMVAATEAGSRGVDDNLALAYATASKASSDGNAAAVSASKAAQETTAKAAADGQKAVDDGRGAGTATLSGVYDLLRKV